MTSCPRCGAELHPLDDLVALARQLGESAAKGRRALDRMRVALPSEVGHELSGIKLDAPILARRLECHAGSCRPGAAE